MTDSIQAADFTVVPENAGISLFSHEFGHNLGAIDLYPKGTGDESTGFWSLMSDSWVGYPLQAGANAFDPYHLEMWGWLDPYVVSDPGREYIVKVGQTSAFPDGEDVHRRVRIELPVQTEKRQVAPIGGFYWWGGNVNLTNARMRMINPVALPAGASTLSFQTAYDIETDWDFLWVQVSGDNGQSWRTLANANTTCQHVGTWIGGQNGFPDDLCAAGIGGFSGKSPEFPKLATQTFDLSAFAGQSILVRFWYMTDWASQGPGAFIDDVVIAAGGQTLFADGAEQGDSQWTYEGTWIRNDGTVDFTHNYYLQWRNTTPTGGFDSVLGDSLWRYGPANTGLIVWYNNNRYTDNDISQYLADPPSFGPKGIMLVVDAHPEPYRDPHELAQGYDNEGSNIRGRIQMRDAPFSLDPTVPFAMWWWHVDHDTQFAPRPGVSKFSDALGYYPGARFVELGKSYDPRSFAWVSEDWDASVVIPSTVPYGINAPGFRTSEWFLYNCGPGNGFLNCNTLNGVEKPSADGGSGNPGDMGGHHGWHVEILEQTNSQATLKIWNDRNVDMPPVASILQPVAGQQISGTTAVRAVVTDDRAVASVTFSVDGQLRHTAQSAPYTWQWDTTGESNRALNLAIRACDSGGQCVSARATPEIANAEAPTVKITEPADATTLGGDVAVRSTVTGAGVSRVRLLVDGVELASITRAPWNFNWNSDDTGAGYRTATVEACNAANACGQASVTVFVEAGEGFPSMAALTNGASFRTGPLAPDEIVTLWGAKLATAFLQSDTTPPATDLGGTSVSLIDSAGAVHTSFLIYVSATQTGLIVPSETVDGPATVRVDSPAGVATFKVLISRTAPGIFTINQNGQGAPAGQALLAKIDGTQSFQFLFDTNAPAGNQPPVAIDMGGDGDQVYLILYGTGLRYHTKIKVTIGGIEVPAVAVAQPQFAGLDQINVGPLPRSLLGQGTLEVVITVDGVAANPVIIQIN